MKKSTLFAIVGAVACVGVSFGTSFADQSCNGVTIKSVGTNANSPSGLFVKVTNTSGGRCGSLLANATMQYFVADDATADRNYATLLTARSLGSKLFIQTGGTGQNNSLLFVTSILPD